VSLLTDFEGGKVYDDWEIGTHGIRIEFLDDKGRRRTATYLPEVMVEQGWTKVAAVDSLLRKGGYKGTITQQVRDGIVLTTYKSSKVHVMYDEWAKARNEDGLHKGKRTE
jgi:AMMECR1 domain-containing protein